MPTDPIPTIANRYRVSEDVCRQMYTCLQQTNGLACHFEIPEFGGTGQWQPGQVMITRWHEHDERAKDLRAKIDGLCSELAAIVRGSDTSAPAALSRPPGTAPAVGHVNLAAGESWWPALYGQPRASGEQSGVRYAYFPAKHRLLIQNGAHIEAYDTADFAITGVSQQQGTHRSLTFASDKGPVPLEQFRCVPLA
jgi:hypothetical protein